MCGSGSGVKGAYLPVEIFAAGENTTACPLMQATRITLLYRKGAHSSFPCLPGEGMRGSRGIIPLAGS